jgi:protocatechuate 3,4-dioxygenase beta subunit
MTVTHFSRRLVLAAAGAMLLPDLAHATSIEVTPRCADGDEPTPAQTAGPYFTPNSPERRSLLEKGMEGQRIILLGFVVDRNCRPVPNALLDLWHADASGAYDNTGYRLRGHQFSDAKGRYRFETIVPGLYPGRTRHLHIKVQAPHQKVLTTQLYFPDEASNASDRIYNPALLLRPYYFLRFDLKPQLDDAVKTYNFMLDVG